MARSCLIACLGLILGLGSAAAEDESVAESGTAVATNSSSRSAQGTAFGATADSVDQGKWICIADAAMGFKYNEGKWIPENLEVKDNRYVVARRKLADEDELPKNLDELRDKILGEPGVFYVTKFGEEYKTKCEDDSPNRIGVIVCNRNTRNTPYSADSFRLDVKQLTYIHIFSIGYFESEYAPFAEYGSLSPHIEIGKCSQI